MRFHSKKYVKMMICQSYVGLPDGNVWADWGVSNMFSIWPHLWVPERTGKVILGPLGNMGNSTTCEKTLRHIATWDFWRASVRITKLSPLSLFTLLHLPHTPSKGDGWYWFILSCGWWFGTWFIFPFSWEYFIIPTDFHMFIFFSEG